MSWMGAFLGAAIGLLVTRTVLGALIGALIGILIEQSGALGSAAAGPRARHSISISDEFFRTTFELMGHVAKSDGRVTEAEIDAARRLMHELQLGAREINIAIGCFQAGKSTAYDAELGVERLRDACGQRYDLLRAFMELQLRAALAGNGFTPIVISAAGLKPGTYHAHVTVQSQNAAANPTTVPITVNVFGARPHKPKPTRTHRR